MTIQDKINALIAHYGKAEAARKIGVQWITVHRWVAEGREPSKHVEPLINRAYKKLLPEPKGDGITDDTEAIQRQIDSGKT